MNLIELYYILGLQPSDNIQNYEIIIKDKNNDKIKNTIELSQLFNWISFNLPLKIN